MLKSQRLIARTLLLTATVFFSATNSLIAQNAEPIESLQKSAGWQWPTADRYRDFLSSYLDQHQSGIEVRNQVERKWKIGAELRGPELMDHLLDTAGLVDPRVAELVAKLRSPDDPIATLNDIPWLTTDVPGWLQDTIRLAFARSLAQRRMVDEALEMMSGLELSQVCDPASLLFYRASAEHHLLKKAECLKDIQTLLEREAELPVRYRQVAHLIQADISPVEEDSVDEIARMMTDVGRRLDLGRAGQKVREREDNIVKKLDKLIDEIEEQAQQMQQQQQSGQQNQNQQSQSQQPMDDSQIAGGTGPGDVDQKKLKDNSSWGNLPPAQRQEALQRLTEELPSHYRDVIEGYFRQLAKDRSR